MANLAIFDLDNTLIAGDSDYLWGKFLVDIGAVDKDKYLAKNAKFYQDYQNGVLDIDAFLRFSLAPLAQHPMEKLQQWRREFVADIIKPVVLKPAIRLVNKHRYKGDTVLVISATNRFITEPIVKLFGIDHLLATTPEIIDGRYSGKWTGTVSFAEGKITLLEEWLKSSKHRLENACFYSDSHNDLPLLKLVGTPIAVDGDKKLCAHAKQHGWQTISLRG